MLLFLLVLGNFGYSYYQTDVKLETFKDTQAELNQQIDSLKKEVARLNDEYAYSQTPEAIEKIARDKLNMVKPNEIIYMIEGLESADGNN